MPAVALLAKPSGLPGAIASAPTGGRVVSNRAEVGDRVGGHQRAGDPLSVGDPDRDLVGVADHVLVGDDAVVLVDDAAAQALTDVDGHDRRLQPADDRGMSVVVRTAAAADPVPAARSFLDRSNAFPTQPLSTSTASTAERAGSRRHYMARFFPVIPCR
jgi:hypothetical protein